MKATAVLALVAVGAISGGAFAAHELAGPSNDRVKVDVVSPAAQTVAPTAAPAVAPSPTATKTPAKVRKVSVAVTSKATTTRKATVKKESAVSEQSKPDTEMAPDDPRRLIVPPIDHGNITPGVPIDANPGATASK